MIIFDGEYCNDYGTLYKVYKFSDHFIKLNVWKYDQRDWDYISCYQKLSEGFIDKHKDRVNWSSISYMQDLSKFFIMLHIKRINFNYLMRNIFISDTLYYDLFGGVRYG